MSEKILVVEDDGTLVKVMKNALTGAGYEIETAVNGNEALEKLRVNEYGLVLLDLVMPGKSGFEVLHELKFLNSAVPVLVFSNLYEEENKKEAMELGARDYFVKSEISIDDLVKKVKEYV